MLETEAVLWTLGEHFRYTRDEAWLARILPNLKLACHCILGERRQRLDDARRSGGGYGLLVGKTADPEDPFESFILNGYAYLGMARAAEMLGHIGDEDAERVASEAAKLKSDIRRAFLEAVEVAASGDIMRVRFECERSRAPARMSVRLPHPDRRRAVAVSSGRYDPFAETATLDGRTGSLDVEMTF